MKRKLYINVYGLIVFICFCAFQKNSRLQDKRLSNKKNEINIDTLNCAPSDTTMPNGHYMKFLLLKDTIQNYQLHWGNKIIDRALEDTFNCEYIEFPGVYLEINDLRNFICLKNSCGFQCSISLFLPLNNDSLPFILYNVLAINADEDIVVFANTEDNFDKNTPKDTLLTVMNLLTRKKQNINLINQPPDSHPLDCIKDIKFKDSCLYVKWDSYIKSPENSIIKKAQFRLKVF